MEESEQGEKDDDSSGKVYPEATAVEKLPPTAAATARTTTAKKEAAPTTGKSSLIPKKNKQSKTASNSTTTTTATTADQVKELGQQTRSRFAQERNKRPEIKRLETAPVVTTPTEESTIAFGTTAKIATIKGHNPQALPLRKRHRAATTTGKSSSSSSGTIRKKRRAPTAQQQQQQQQQQVDETVDDWCPDVSQLLRLRQPHSSSISNISTTKMEDRSNCVRLHGLPLHTTTAHIQSFFRGLNPERIVLLPSLHQHLPTWDAPVLAPPPTAATTTPPPVKKSPGPERHHHHRRQQQQPLVERYPFHFRVLVKFQSAPTAALAVDRSGELLTVPTTTTIHGCDGININNGSSSSSSSSSGGGLKKVAISVTPVQKSEATYLLRHLAIDADSSSLSSNNTYAPSLATTLTRIEQALGQDVTFILWSAAKQNLQLTSVDLSSLAASLSSSTSTTSATNLASLLVCKNLNCIKSRKVVVKQRNQLLELYQRMLSPACAEDHEHESSTSCSMLDPELLALDPILRLTINAASCVMEQVKRMDERLLILMRVQQKQFSSFHALPPFRSKRRPDDPKEQQQQQAQQAKDS
jgi:hypothetical protein